MNIPMGGDDFPSPGADYDPDAAMMQARATRDLQRQMQWMADLLGKYEEEILTGGGRKFMVLADLMGSDPQSNRKWRIDGAIDAVSVTNPGTIRAGVKFDTALKIQNLDGEFDMSSDTARLYLKGVYTDPTWTITLTSDGEWDHEYPIKEIDSGYDYTTFYFPIAVSHPTNDLEAAGIEPVISKDGVGVMVVAPDADLTLSDNYFMDEEIPNRGQYMVYPSPLPGDIYLP